MNVFLTGADGQLGSDLAPRLTAAGHNVIASSRATLDLTDAAAVAGTLERLRPDCIMNCAAYTAVDQAEVDTEAAFAVNRDAVATLARAATAIDALVIHVSTDYVFDGTACRPYPEQAPLSPVSAYGRSKAAGEQSLAATGCRHAIVRTAWLYGGNGPNFVKTMLKLAAERAELTVVDDQIGSPTYSADLADFLALLPGSGASGVFHYTNEGVASWYDFAVAILEEAHLAGWTLQAARVRPIPTEAFPRPAPRPAYSVLGKARARAVPGAKTAHWRAGLRRMLAALAASAGAARDATGTVP